MMLFKMQASNISTKDQLAVIVDLIDPCRRFLVAGVAFVRCLIMSITMSIVTDKRHFQKRNGIDLEFEKFGKKPLGIFQLGFNS